ncbi:response regulator transcription factor [Streptomyces sp. NPDC059862]|uniref:response regulator transcription factor n=1 Tax=Streptomyces sp. NPDC059862 TaxID=3346975 RepID=UPI00364A27F5
MVPRRQAWRAQDEATGERANEVAKFTGSPRGAASKRCATEPAKTDPLTELTAEQREVVRPAERGLRNQEITEQLKLSPRTVSSHLCNVYPKQGVSSHNQLRGSSTIRAPHDEQCGTGT